MTDEDHGREADIDLSLLLGFRDISGLGEDAMLIAEGLDAAHVKIGTEVGQATSDQR